MAQVLRAPQARAQVRQALPVLQRLAGTSSPAGKGSPAARCEFPLRGTSPQSFAGAPSLCSAVNIVEKSPSAQSDRRVPAVAGLLRSPWVRAPARDLARRAAARLTTVLPESWRPGWPHASKIRRRLFPATLRGAPG